MAELTLEERYLEAVRRLRVRVDHLEEMALWKENLTSRLWRVIAVQRATGEAVDDIKTLEREIGYFLKVSEALSRKQKL